MKKISILLLLTLALFSRGQNTLEKHYGDAVDCSGINVIQTFDNGFLITAAKNPVSQFEADLFIIKTDALGDTLWTRTIPLESGKIGKGIQTSDSGFLFTGKTGIYLFLTKLNKLGELLWTEKFGFYTTYAFGRSVIESSDHDLYVVGEYFIGVTACCAPLVLKTDQSGNLLSPFSLPYAEHGRTYDIVETPDSNFVISYSSIESGPPIPQLAKVDKIGNTLWHKEYDPYCECHVNLTHDNGFIISGSEVSYGTPYLVKTDSAGNVIWNKNSAGYSVFNNDLKVTPTNDDGYLMTGGSGDPSGDLKLLKINSAGDSIWGRVFGGSGDDFGRSIITTNDNGFAIVGYTTSFGSAFKEVYFLKTDSLGLITSIRKYPKRENVIQIFPNPFSVSTTVQISEAYKNLTLSVLNSFGKEVRQFKNMDGSSITMDRGDLPGGIYFLQLSQKNKIIAVEKIVILDN